MLTTKNQVRDRAVAGLIFLIVAVLLAGCSPPGPRSFTNGMELYKEGKFAEALEQFRTATSELATNAIAWHYVGLSAQKAGQPAEAERAYARALTLDRDLVEARYNLGCLLLDQNRAEEAKAHFTTYHLRRPNELAGCLKLGSAQLRSREPLGAEKSFGTALRIAPTNAEALNGLGLARLQRGRGNEAVQFFSTALRHSPGYAPALLNLGIVRQVHLKDKAGALQAYQEYLRVSPGAHNAAAVTATVKQLQQELGTGSRQPGQQGAALSAGDTASTFASAEAPPGPAPSTTSASTQAQVPPTRPTGATGSFNKPVSDVASRSPQPPAATVSRSPQPQPQPRVPPVASAPTETVRLPAEPVIKPAQEVSNMRTEAQAASSTPRAVAESPVLKPEPQKKRGFLQSINPLNLFSSDDKAVAGASAAKAPASDPGETSGGAGAEDADNLDMKGKHWPKYTYRKPVLPPGRNRANAELAFAVGVKAQSAHRLEEAIQEYRKATQLDPSYFEAHYNLGLAQAALGRLAGALSSYEDALSVEPQSLDARYNFALTLRQANYIPDAVAEFKKLLRTYPNEGRAHLALGNLYSQQLGQPELARPHYLKVLQVEPRHPQASAIRYWLAANPK